MSAPQCEMARRETLCLLCVGAKCRDKVMVLGRTVKSLVGPEMELVVGFCFECGGLEEVRVRRVSVEDIVFSEEICGEIVDSVRRRVKLICERLRIELKVAKRGEMIGLEGWFEESKAEFPAGMFGISEEVEKWMNEEMEYWVMYKVVWEIRSNKGVWRLEEVDRDMLSSWEIGVL